MWRSFVCWYFIITFSVNCQKNQPPIKNKNGDFKSPLCPRIPLHHEYLNHPLFPESKVTIIKEITKELILFNNLTFLIFADYNSTSISNIYFQARLIGTAIIHIPFKEICPGVYRFSFQIYDPGEYHLQIRISWFIGMPCSTI